MSTAIAEKPVAVAVVTTKAAKAPAKTTAKAPAKAAAKAPAKTVAKAPAKTAAKAPVAEVEKPVEAPVKPAAKRGRPAFLTNPVVVAFQVSSETKDMLQKTAEANGEKLSDILRKALETYLSNL